MRKWLRPAKPGVQLRSAGDAARNAGDWPAAADHYRAYLAIVPADTAIWVQYGHVSKEDGALGQAEQAYRRALRLAPDDAEVRLHLAHLLKTMGRPQDASAMFLELTKSVPSAENLNERKLSGNGYQALQAITRRPPDVPGNAIFIELKDLFQYLSLHTTVTGITRVTLGLVNYVLYEMDDRSAHHYRFVHHYGDGEGLLLIGKDYMRRIVRAAMHDEPDLPAMQDLIGEIRAKSIVFRLAAGDTYLIVGAFWEFVANPSWIGGMRNRGVIVGSYIYDLIPITHAQYCMRGLTTAFTTAFAETARLLNFALTISSFVADDLRGYLQAHGATVFPVVPVPLAHELRFQDRSGDDLRPAPWRASHHIFLPDIPFVLCVCTIEARKNHDYLFRIWQRMLDEKLVVPDLVFVGRPGWRVEDLLRDLELSDYLDGRLHILNGLSDDELNDLYERCSFTAFPSFVEGWGLPVGESLAHGKVCVASSASSIPEVGGDYAIYVDPFDIDQGYEVISGLVREPGRVAALESRIRASFRPRTWNDVGRDFFEATGRLIEEQRTRSSGQRLFAPRIASATMLDVAKLGRISEQGAPYVANPQRLVFARGWRGVEPSGTWMLDPDAEVRLQTDCEPGQHVSVVLHFDTSPWLASYNVLSISADGGHGVPYRRPMQKESDYWVTIDGRVDDAGILTIGFALAGDITTPGGELEPVGVRLRAIGYAPVTDRDGRIKLLEAALTLKA